MKKNPRKLVASTIVSFAALYGFVTFVGCSGSESDPPVEPKTTYEGTIYMASTSGGHIAVVPVTIDPSDTATPITVGTLSRIQLSSGMGAGNQTHNFHDVRLDGNQLFYSAIKVDVTGGADDGMAHLGWVDLASGNAVSDAVLDAAPLGTAMVYCGSGQTGTHFLPMTMSHPAYIDAVAKADLVDGAVLASGLGAGDVKRTFVEDFRADSDYIFAHGVDSPDGTRLYVAVNDTSAGNGGTTAGMTGSITGYLLDMADVVAGSVSSASVSATETVSGLAAAGTTIAFRSTYTPDGTKILQASRDRLLVLDAANLTLLDNATAIGGTYAGFGVENHDAMPTPDGKYAILALRYRHASGGTLDGGIQLYDLAAKAAIGDPVSTCNACHSPGNPAADTKDRALCGLDGAFTVVTQ